MMCCVVYRGGYDDSICVEVCVLRREKLFLHYCTYITISALTLAAYWLADDTTELSGCGWNSVLPLLMHIMLSCHILMGGSMRLRDGGPVMNVMLRCGLFVTSLLFWAEKLFIV